MREQVVHRSFVIGILLLFLLVPIAINSCISSPTSEIQQEDGQNEFVGPAFGKTIPPPLSLNNGRPATRGSSYTENDLYRPGKFFDKGLPSDNIREDGDNVIFEASWEPGAGIAGLAYCTFSFPAEGFDRELELHYRFSGPPEDWGTVWLAAADWAANSWRWRSAEPGGVVSDLLTTDTFDTAGDVWILFACFADSDTPALEWVHLGPPKVDAAIQTFFHSGVAPLAVHADASASSTAIGEISQYEWDWDGDGTFEETTGETATADHTYTEAGEFQPTVRVTTSIGAVGVKSTTMTISAPWVHSWGGSGYDSLVDMDYGPSDHLYFCGSTTSYGEGGSDALLLKYDLLGNLVWARCVGGSGSDTFVDIDVANDGSIYAVGNTTSGDGDDWNVFLQHWSEDGNLLSSKIWGTSKDDDASGAMLDGSYIYVVGYSDINVGEDGPLDMFAARFSLAGEMDWAKTISIAYGVIVEDILVSSPPFEDIEVHVTGTVTNMDNERAMYYLHLNESGTTVSSRRWESSDETEGHNLALLLYPERHLYVLGSRLPNAASDELLLVEFADSGNPLAWTWTLDSGHAVRPAGVIASRDGLTIAGYSPLSDSSLLIYTDLEGALTRQIIYSTSPSDTIRFNGLAPFPGRGYVAFGTVPSAMPVTDNSVSLQAQNHLGTWQNQPTSPQDLTNSSEDWFAAVQHLTDGVIDTGGGNSDCLLLAAPQR